jgi:hypothetical protein
LGTYLEFLHLQRPHDLLWLGLWLLGPLLLQPAGALWVLLLLLVRRCMLQDGLPP